jgi:hypothetical protein
VRYQNQSISSFQVAAPPDADDLRPGHDFRLMAASIVKGAGRLWVWDAEHDRVLLYDKASGDYLEQYLAAPGTPALSGMKGMFVIEGEAGPSTLVWTNGTQLLSTSLVDVSAVAPSPSPSGGPSAGPSTSASP